jgi:hypothetical protein
MAFQDGDILGETSRPEHPLPENVERGDVNHLHFLSLTMALSSMRDQEQLWAASRATFNDPGTHYLFYPETVAALNRDKLENDMQIHDLASNTEKDADIWYRICTTLMEEFDGSMCRLIDEAGNHIPTILETLRKHKYDFPYLGGNKTGSLWAMMLADSWQGRASTGLHEIPIYIDRDVAAATVEIGAVQGPFDGRFTKLKHAVEDAWAAACEDIDFYPMQFHRPLERLGSRGCRENDGFPCKFRTECPVMIFCTESKFDSAKRNVAVDEPGRPFH